MTRTLIIAPHMDDEVLSTGVLIHRRVKKGGIVSVLTLFGRTYDYGKDDADYEFSKEKEDFLRAKKVLRYHHHTNYNFKEGEPYQTGYYQLLEVIEGEVSKFRPTELVFPHPGDLNQDHQFTHRVCQIVSRPANLGGVMSILTSLAMDRSWSDPTYFVPHSEAELKVKLAALACYQRESRVGSHTRSPENIAAHHRLCGSKCGEEYAEPYFSLLQKECRYEDSSDGW